MKNRNHSLTAYATIPAGGAQGVLVCSGGLYGGYSFFVDDNRLVYEYNAYNEDRFRIQSNRPLPAGEVELKADYEATSQTTGTVTLYVNGAEVARGEVGRTMPGTFSLSETFDVGQDTGTPVSKGYTRDNAFSGNLDRVVVALAQ